MSRWQAFRHAAGGAWSVFRTLYLGLRAYNGTADKAVFTAQHTVTIE